MKNTFAIFILSLITTIATAGPGHDHSEEASISAGDASPRVVMESNLFEAVGILKGRTLEFFIDHAATTTPVKNVEPALTLNGVQVPLEQHAEGEFDAVVPDAMIGENLKLALRVTVGDQTEVLGGELTFNEDHQDHAEGVKVYFLAYLKVIGAVLIALLALAWIAMFSKRSSKGAK